MRKDTLTQNGHANIDTWIDGYKVTACPWVDGKTIHFNVQYFRPGQSLSQPPIFDKTVYITGNESGKFLVYELTDSLVRHVAKMQIADGYKVVITANDN